MTTPSDAYEFGSQPVAPPMSQPRPFYWSVRRELWENRSIYLAPILVAAFVLFGSLISTCGMPKKLRTIDSVEPARQHVVIVKPFLVAPAPIMLACFIVGVFYSLDALYGERRDRSILFWKSLPVSDRTAVLSKASIPLVVLPAIAFVLGIIVLAIMLVQSTIVLTVSGVGPLRLWRELEFVHEPLSMIYGLTVHSLWFAPIYCWLLLLSVWAKRSPILWATLPLFAIAAVEKIGFNTSNLAELLRYRVTGAMQTAFIMGGHRGGAEDVLTPLRFLRTPGLWLGLLFAAACLAAAIRLRRRREPI